MKIKKTKLSKLVLICILLSITLCMKATDTNSKNITSLKLDGTIIKSYNTTPISITTDKYNRSSVYEGNINKYNSKGHKHGTWIDDNEYFLSFDTYLDGKLDGPQISYWKIINDNDSTYKLSNIVNYHNGELQSPIITFDDNGLIVGIITKIEPVKDFIDLIPDYFFNSKSKIMQGYEYYYQNGRLVSEGWAVFLNDSYEVDYSEVGEHKVYNEDGTYTIRTYPKLI